MKFRRRLLLILFIVLSYQKFATAEIATSEELKTDQSSLSLQDKKKNTNSCKQLEAGHSLTINQNFSQSPTGTERKYKLTKDKNNPKRYIASLNLKLLPTFERIDEKYGTVPIAPSDILYSTLSASYGSYDVKLDETRAAMIARTKECFKQAQGKVKSPDGTILDFELLNTLSAGEVKEVPILITTKNARSSSFKWAGELDCGVIIHEVLHLMGLCDGYQERDTLKEHQIAELKGIIDFTTPDTQSIYKDSDLLYDCRALAPESNIMNTSYIPEETYQITQCLDLKRVGNPLLQKQQCPKDLVKTFKVSKSHLDDILKRAPRTKETFLSTTNIGETAILANAQMRLITLPHCYEKNNLYITCAQNAYRTDALEGCLEMPIECKNGDYLK